MPNLLNMSLGAKSLSAKLRSAKLFTAALTSVLGAIALPSHAQESAASWPSKPVRIIVPFPAGGTADVLPRFVAEGLSAKWGQTFLVENGAGAAGNIGAEAVFKADPDGYTLLSAPPPPLVINPSLYPKLAFDPTQFVTVSVLAEVPNVFPLHPKIPANNVREAIAESLKTPEMRKRVVELSAEPGGTTPAEMTAYMRQDAERWRNVIRMANVKAD